MNPPTMIRTIELHRDELYALWIYVRTLEDVTDISPSQLGMYPIECVDLEEAMAKLDRAVSKE